MEVAPSWADPGVCDLSPIDPETLAARRTEQAHHLRAERQYRDHAKAETGIGFSPEEIAKQQAARSEIRAQSHEIARRLESVGKSAYRSDSLFLWAYFVHSQKREPIPNFRRICLLPFVAAMVRAPKLAALEYYIERNPFCRFWTFTLGKRCRIDQLRERVQLLHRRLSRLSSWLRAEYGVELVFRSTEFGTLEASETGQKNGDAGSVEYDENGEPLFHPHAHCVVQSLRGFIPPRRWSKMIEAVWSYWGHHWDAGASIRDARECCKYVTKPGDMLKLSAENLGELHEAVFGLRLVAPMGQLKKQIRERKEAKKTLRRYRPVEGRTGEGMVWREVYDQNAFITQDEADREAYWEHREAVTMARETAIAAQTEPGTAPDMDLGSNADFCRVFARLSPSLGPSGVKEPRVIVGGTHWNSRAVTEHPLVVRLWEDTVMEFEAGAALSVHTGTPTVRDSETFEFVPDIPERVKPPSPPIFEPEPSR
ncbi:hypothetical protein [Synoicihabitans lomoniglobus]|uniref:Replication protein n=1 Tax=Synoicihabitans lomoniglobus TaxID=2909285 RepID=A0AAF0CRV3_9BACT|nr:protein rep [Opitutaceae bacterium LMO-M01]WED66859.1 hypothetical protein PXH66_08350 [Opitutaceae bacterium LMO-M01]